MPRKQSENSLKNLIDTRAPDRPGDTVAITVRVSKDDAEWLSQQPESKSYYVRQALTMFRKNYYGDTDTKIDQLRDNIETYVINGFLEG